MGLYIGLPIITTKLLSSVIVGSGGYGSATDQVSSGAKNVSDEASKKGQQLASSTKLKGNK